MLIVPETCRANDERNKEYSVHIFGPELNIYNTGILLKYLDKSRGDSLAD
jgi:hypothetical protein